MFRCTLECWKQLENIGTLLRNKYEKVGNEWGELASLALWEAWGSIPQALERLLGHTGWCVTPWGGLQSPFWGALVGAVPHPLPQVLAIFLLRFSTLNLLNLNGSFPKHLESFIPSISNRFNLKNNPEIQIKSILGIQQSTNKNSTMFFKNFTFLTFKQLQSLLNWASWCVCELTQHERISHTLIGITPDEFHS